MLEKIRNSQKFLRLEDTARHLSHKYLYTDESFIRKRFERRLGRELNLENPVKYNDKLQWLKLNWYDPLATKAADKYGAREFVTEKIGSEYLNKMYGVYESVDEINLDELPQSFVLKGTHGSGYNIICKDKNKMDWKTEFEKMDRWMHINYFWQNREWVYKDIQPRIISENFLEDSETDDLRDYKIFCFNGEPKLVQVHLDRFSRHKRNLYDINWNFIDVENANPNAKDIEIKEPKNLDEMIRLSKILSEGFPHVRVDFYEVNEKIYFGELTFFHGSGVEWFSPEEFEVTMGNWLELPKLEKRNQ